MKKLFPLLLLVPLLFTSCEKSKIPEGEITYDITYPHMEVTGLMSAILPKEMRIIFKGTRMKTTINRGRIFTTDVITDELTQFIEMRLDFGDKKYCCELTKEEIKKLKDSQPNYTIEETGQQDSISGMWCSLYTVSSPDIIQPMDAWFTEDFTVGNGAWFSAYFEVIGMPVVYDVERYGLMMHVEANKFIQREVKDNEFDRTEELRQVDFKIYEEEVQELFDILLK